MTVNFATSAGNVKVRGNNTCGSGSYRTKAISIVCREASDLNSETSLSYYPSPVSGIMNVSFYIQKASDYTIILNDVSGKKLMQMNCQSVIGQNEQQLDLTGFAPGIYMMTFINDNARTIKKVLVD